MPPTNKYPNAFFITSPIVKYIFNTHITVPTKISQQEQVFIPDQLPMVGLEVRAQPLERC